MAAIKVHIETKKYCLRSMISITVWTQLKYVQLLNVIEHVNDYYGLVMALTSLYLPSTMETA